MHAAAARVALRSPTRRSGSKNRAPRGAAAGDLRCQDEEGEEEKQEEEAGEEAVNAAVKEAGDAAGEEEAVASALHKAAPPRTDLAERVARAWCARPLRLPRTLILTLNPHPHPPPHPHPHPDQVRVKLEDEAPRPRAPGRPQQDPLLR